MIDLILLEKDLQIVTESLSVNVFGIGKQYILCNWILNQLKEKLQLSQHNLVISSPKIQNAFAEKLEYKTTPENIKIIID